MLFLYKQSGRNSQNAIRLNNYVIGKGIFVSFETTYRTTFFERNGIDCGSHEPSFAIISVIRTSMHFFSNIDLIQYRFYSGFEYEQ